MCARFQGGKSRIFSLSLTHVPYTVYFFRRHCLAHAEIGLRARPFGRRIFVLCASLYATPSHLGLRCTHENRSKKYDYLEIFRPKKRPQLPISEDVQNWALLSGITRECGSFTGTKNKEFFAFLENFLYCGIVGTSCDCSEWLIWSTFQYSSAYLLILIFLLTSSQVMILTEELEFFRFSSKNRWFI